MKKVFSVFIIVAVTACAHHFETAKFDTGKWEPTGNKIDGLVYFEPQLVRVRYEFTALVDKDGILIGTSEGKKCRNAVQKEELSIQPNFSEPRVLIYKPSPFAAGSFGVKLTNGMLESINTQSTPQLPELLGQVAKFKEVGILAAPPKEGTSPACNSAPIITSIQKQEIPWP